MSMGPLNSLAGAAGSSLAQSRGTDADRTGNEVEQDNAKTRVHGSTNGDSVEENRESSDRDADGRQLMGSQAKQSEASENESSDESKADEQRQSKDVSGELGRRLDISG